MIKIGLVSLGCAKNLVDSEILLGMFSSEDFIVVNKAKEADIIIVNTCGFIAPSKKESIDTILEMAQYKKKLVVVGCLVERYKKELIKEIPEVDLWVSIKEYKNLANLLKNLIGSAVKINEFNPYRRILATPPFSAYFRISEGCNNRCTFCAIPLIRGGFKSRPYDELLKEADILAKNNIKELVVISQDTTRYGSDLKEGKNIIDLLKALLSYDSFKSIRLLYLYPDEISDELIDLVALNPRIAPYFDVPIQHASSSVLKRMHRRGDEEFLTALFSKIRSKVPGAILRTTYIVGFPGESGEDFKELIDFTKKIEFDHLGVFVYSQEDSTASANYSNQIDEEVKNKRKEEIMKVQSRISFKRNKTHIGEVMEGIVIEYNSAKNMYLLRSYYNAPDDIDGNIYFTTKKEIKVGDIVKVKINDALVYDLVGTMIE